METTPPFLGFNNFVWFFGKIEDRDDPLQIGRVKVRVFGVYPEEIVIEDLPWALPIQTINSSASSGVGISPTGLQVGSMVFGFFADGKDVQRPIVIGSWAGQDDVANLAIGENTIEKPLTGPEPASTYAAKYPFNKVTTTESGHAIEVDDTPEAERIHHYHKSGTYTEMTASGDYVIKSAAIMYQVAIDNIVVHSDKDILETAENKTVTINSNYGLIAKDVNIESDSYQLTADTTNVDSNTTNVDSNTTNIKGSSVTVDGSTTTIKGSSTVKIQGGSVPITGSSFTFNGKPVLVGSISGGSF